MHRLHMRSLVKEVDVVSTVTLKWHRIQWHCWIPALRMGRALKKINLIKLRNFYYC